MRFSGYWRLGAFLVLIWPASPAWSESPETFAGKYLMQGKGSGVNDTAYTGTCTLENDAGLYSVSCFNEDTRHTYTGKGIATGNTLAIFIGDTLRGDHNEIYTGEYLVVYTRAAGGALSGAWVHTQGLARGAETLTPAN